MRVNFDKYGRECWISVGRGDEPANNFEVDERFLFTHHFEEEDVFVRLRWYYNNQQYRFQFPPEEFREIPSVLTGYGLVVVNAVKESAAVVKKYTNHSEHIFKESVGHRSIDGYTCFAMVRQTEVERAVHE